MAIQPNLVITDSWYCDQKKWFDRVMLEIRDLLEYHPEISHIVFKEVRKLTRQTKKLSS